MNRNDDDDQLVDSTKTDDHQAVVESNDDASTENEVTVDEYEYEYEDDDNDNDHHVGFLVDNPDAVAEKSLANQTNQQVMAMNVKLDAQNSAGNRRLVKDLARVMQTHTPGIAISPLDDDALHIWTVELSEFDPDSMQDQG